MARASQSLFAINKGIVSRFALARYDVKRLTLAAQVQTNWMPRVMGPAMLRAGLGYIGATLSNAAARMLRHMFATDDCSLVELTNGTLRVWINDVLLARNSVSSTVTNGTFNTDVAGWTDNDEVGGTSSWVAPGYMQLLGDGTNRAIRDQTVSVGINAGTEHALRIVIARGPVLLRVGSSVGDDSYVNETTLLTGTHSIAFTPTGDFSVRFASSEKRVVWIDSCTVEAGGVVTLPTPWTAAHLSKVRYDQSADVLYVACAGLQQRRIERRGTRPGARSWSVTTYAPPDGPFDIQNTGPITITASAITGNVTLTASKALFRSTHVGALFSLTSTGQTVTAALSAANTWTNSVRVTGLDSERPIQITISGTFVATLTLQRSFDNATWASTPKTWTAPVAEGYNDALTNQIVYYRVGIDTANYTSGTANVTVSIAQGSIRGIVRITGFTSSTSVGAEVLTDLGGTTASKVWQEGLWSDAKSWPTSIRFYEGRLWWAGKNGIWGSISDAYDSFDETFLGDAGPINRTIGAGPVDTINWICAVQRMILGAQGAELSVRSTSLDEPLTPTNFHMKAASTQGSGGVDVVTVDQNGYFVDRTGAKVFEMVFDIRTYDYVSSEITQLAQEIGLPGIVRIDVQRKPDTRVHCVRSDGVVVVAVMNKAEDMLAWVQVQTSGFVEDVVVLPAVSGNLDDQVYYVVRRTINGATVRYIEKYAQESDCRGDQALCKLADAYKTYTGAATATITGLSHLEGQSVVVWADGADVGTNDSAVTWTQRYTVAGGQITLTTPASNVVVGLGYTAQFQSAKLGFAAQGMESPLNTQKRIDHLGLVMAQVHRKGVRYGADFDHLNDMPGIEDGTTVTGEVTTDYDQNPLEFPGVWTTDSRVCLQAQAPRPVTVMGVTLSISEFK